MCFGSISWQYYYPADEGKKGVDVRDACLLAILDDSVLINITCLFFLLVMKWTFAFVDNQSY